MRAALLALAATACGPTLVWHGRSPDRRHELRVVEHRHRQYVVLDGVRGPTFGGIAISTLTFSPDSKHFAYAASVGASWRVVADGRAGPPFSGIHTIQFSADSAHVAYVAQRGRHWSVVLDGTLGPTFEGLLADSLTFSPDGRHLAYVALRDGGKHAVIDGVVGPRFEGVGRLAFSDDSAHVGYLARTAEDRAVAVIDGTVGPPFATIETLVLARGRSGYVAQTHGRWYAVIDGAMGTSYDRVRGLAFSEDATHVAFVARRAQGDSFVVTDGVEGTSYTGVRPATLAFAPGAAQPTYVAQRDYRFFVVHAGSEGPAFDDVSAPVLGADDAHYVYVGSLGSYRVPVIAGVEGPRESWIGDIAVAPAGARTAYVARRGADVEVVVDGTRHRFDIVLDRTLQFDASGAHWGCIAGSRAEKKFHVIVDGARAAELEVTEAIDVAIRAQVAGKAADEGVRVLRTWVTAELAAAGGPK